jgi:hypothetical protein
MAFIINLMEKMKFILAGIFLKITFRPSWGLASEWSFIVTYINISGCLELDMRQTSHFQIRIYYKNDSWFEIRIIIFVHDSILVSLHLVMFLMKSLMNLDSL